MSERKPLVLVTGANGFIGRHLASALSDAGWKLRRAVREQSSVSGDVVVGTLGPQTNWEAACAGAHAVVHLAARVHQKREDHAESLYRQINVEGTLQLARAAQRAGVRHFFFLSTVLVHGRTNHGRAAFNENDPLTPQGLYGMSKAAAESGLQALSTEADMSITVIRPPMVYGYGAKGNFALLSRAVDRGLPLPFAGICNRRPFISVQNLSSFILWRLSHPDPGSRIEAFLVSDGEQVSTPDFIKRLAAAGGKRARLFRLPTAALRAGLTALGRSDTFDSLVESLDLDISKALSTGWRPEFGVDDALRLAWSPPNA